LPPSYVFSPFCVAYLPFSGINIYFMHFRKADILSSIYKVLRYLAYIFQVTHLLLILNTMKYCGVSKFLPEIPEEIFVWIF